MTFLRQKQFEVNIQIPDTPIFAYTDNEALQRIFKNLIDNAIRHGGDGKYISLRLTTSNGKNIIEIEDRGDGISPQQQNRSLKGIIQQPEKLPAVVWGFQFQMSC